MGRICSGGCPYAALARKIRELLKKKKYSIT